MYKSFRILSVLLVLVFLVSCMTVLSAHADEITRYGRTTIEDEPNVLYAYDILRDKALAASTEKTDIPQSMHLTDVQLIKAFQLFESDYPECFWIENLRCNYIGSDIIGITPVHVDFGDITLTRARELLETAVSDIMSGMPQTNNYDKALYLHDRLVSWVTYEEIGEHQTVYGALVAGKAVCAGYAAAYQLLLNRAGIDAWTIGGKSGDEGIPHAWNVVWIEENVCVYTDATWADQETDIYHYYFNISKAEMAEDHDVETAIYELPDCNHDNESYFDKNGHVADDDTTASELAAFFSPAKGGKRTAAVYYEGDDIKGFCNKWEEDVRKIYTALGGGNEAFSYSISAPSGREIRFEITADIGVFPENTYEVNTYVPSYLVANGSILQHVEVGAPMEAIILTAGNEYYFPETYAVPEQNGISVQRISAKQIKVWGTPTANTSITLPEPTMTQKHPAPSATYTPAAEAGSGTLSGVAAGMKYSFDGMNWIDITSSSNITLDGITSSKIYVVMIGDGITALNSDKQILTVANPIADTEENTEDKSTVLEDDAENAPTKDNTQANADKQEENNASDKTATFFGCQMSASGTPLTLVVLLLACLVLLKKKRIN